MILYSINEHLLSFNISKKMKKCFAKNNQNLEYKKKYIRQEYNLTIEEVIIV